MAGVGWRAASDMPDALMSPDVYFHRLKLALPTLCFPLLGPLLAFLSLEWLNKTPKPQPRRLWWYVV